jgi:hypothetical protein
MIMKRNILITFSVLVLFFCLGFLFSCNDLLKEEPYGVYSNDNYFQTEEDALNSVLYAYDPINNIEYGSRFLFYLTDVPTNQYKSYNKGYESALYNWEINSNTEDFTYFFKYAYLSIARANNVLENVSKMNNITEKAKQQYLGEAYFIRAFNYFMLVRTFGEVPLHDKVVESVNESRTSYASLDKLYSFIIEDLEKAIDMMSISKQQGRADKVAAQSLLSKVYLTLASSKMTNAPGYDWVSDYEAMYAKAAEYAYEVVENQSVYGLDPDLANVYDVESQSTGIEHIFITSMSRDGWFEEGDFSQLPQLYTIGLPGVYISKSLTGGGPVIPTVHPEVWNWQVLRVDDAFYDSYDDNDLRKRLMVTTIYNEDGSVRATWSKDNLTSSDPVLFQFYYPFCRKYTDPKSNVNRTSGNVYLMRFAEVALTYAEAVGPTEQGYKWVNKVRARAGLDELSPGLSVREFREAIWEELTYELAFEGHGLLELRRINKVMENITNKVVNPEYAYFYPIPQRELDLNPRENN